MKAWLLQSLGGLDALRLADAPGPVPGLGEVVLDMRFAALNPADRYLAEGQYPAHPPLPHILGRDGLGIVSAVGTGVKSVRLGDRRVILFGETGVKKPGTFAERVAVPADALVEVPPGWSEQEAAGAALVYLTAWQALTQWGSLPPSVVLVTGASGGVGVASVQLAHAMGHTVIVLSRDQGKREKLKALGAGFAFDPSDPDWRKAALAALNGSRVDLAIDSIGGPLLPQVIDAMGECGRVSIVGRLAGPVPQFNTATLLFRRLRLGGVAVGAYGPVEGQITWRSIVTTLQKAGARPLVDSVFPFEKLPAAFERLGAGPMGKVLLQVQRDVG